MPTYIDRHRLTAVPAATRTQLHVEAMSGLVDPGGARAVGHWIDDGVIYCIVNAPSMTSVWRHHQARGLPCDDVHVMQDLHELRPTSREDKALVRSAIDAFWPADQTDESPTTT